MAGKNNPYIIEGMVGLPDRIAIGLRIKLHA
jgi:hypothetical protein